MKELKTERFSIAICDDEAATLNRIQQMSGQILDSQWKPEDFLNRGCSFACCCHVSFSANMQWAASMRKIL